MSTPWSESNFRNPPLPAVGNVRCGADRSRRRPWSQNAAHLTTHRGILLGQARDAGTFFVKSVKATSLSAKYNSASLYEAWRLAIQRYGIFNPYTGRGAIKGLLSHGPHNVRDVLATHILKQTGSYEQASYAIQGTPDMVAKHYGRFLPHTPPLRPRCSRMLGPW